MTFKIKDKVLVKERGKGKLGMFLLLKAPLHTEPWLSASGHSVVHISFKQVHEVHVFQSATSWDLNLRTPLAAGGLYVKYRLLSELADPLTS